MQIVGRCIDLLNEQIFNFLCITPPVKRIYFYEVIYLDNSEEPKLLEMYIVHVVKCLPMQANCYRNSFCFFNKTTQMFQFLFTRIVFGVNTHDAPYQLFLLASYIK